MTLSKILKNPSLSLDELLPIDVMWTTRHYILSSWPVFNRVDIIGFIELRNL